MMPAKPGPWIDRKIRPMFSRRKDERRPPFEDDIVRYYGQYVALAVADTDLAHARHLLGCDRVDPDHAAVGDRCADRDGIQHPGKVAFRWLR
jgi:cbb3-type cytochrome oxidase cytochrome c subunit